MDAIRQVIEGGNPEEIAQQVGMDPQQLVALSDSFVKQTYQHSLLGEAAERKIGRNEPCPCGSDKKYKKCCLRKHEKIRELLRGSIDFQEQEAEEGPPEYIIQGFDLLGAGNYEEAIKYTKNLLPTYPEDDRLHDTLASAYLATRQYDEPIDICRGRWEVAKEEKSFYKEHGHHKRLPQGGDGAAPHFYPPETWLEKYWIALKAKEYSGLLPDPQNPEIARLIEDLLTANDQNRFPGQQEEGLEQRREALNPTIEKLKDAGPDAIPYLLQMMRRFSWATLFVPDIVAHYSTEEAIHRLIDLTMFGYHYVSETCLKHLESLGTDVLPYVRAAIDREKEFDALKVGLINMIGSLDTPEVDELLVELLKAEEPEVVDWAGLVLGKRDRVDLLPTLEEANSRIGDKPRIGWAINRLSKLKEDKE
jgi:tetratricopeptide (TPR) repeat protein